MYNLFHIPYHQPYANLYHVINEASQRTYACQQKIREVSAETQGFLSVNWNSEPCMAESSPTTLAPPSL
jgi:hypothetical protein